MREQDFWTDAVPEFPKVLVLGAFAVGKTSVIGAVMSGCAKVMASSARPTVCSDADFLQKAANSFCERNPFDPVLGESDAKWLVECARLSDAVWIVLKSASPLSHSEMSVLQDVLRCSQDVLIVVTQVDAIDAGERAVIYSEFRKYNVKVENGQICSVNAMGECPELVDQYFALCEKKRERTRNRSQTEIKEYERFVQSGILGFDIDRYRDSICYYCMSHDPASEKEYMETRKPPFPISDTFRNRVRLVLQTPAPVLYLEHPDLRDLPAQGYDLIQTIQHGFKYWRDRVEDEEIAAKAKYVVEKIDELGCEMGVAGNFPSVADYVIDVLDYAAEKLKRSSGHVPVSDHVAAPVEMSPAVPEGSGSERRTGTVHFVDENDGGQISGYQLVERMLDRFREEGVAKLLECTDHRETEYLEFKTSHLLSDEERKKGVRQDALTWDIVQAIFAIANTSGGALLIGIRNDGRSVLPLEVGDDVEKYVQQHVMQKLLPDQRCWNDDRKGRWTSSGLPKVEPRMLRCSECDREGYVCVLLIEPQPRGRCLVFEDLVNRNGSLLCYRKIGYGRTVSSKDSIAFATIDNERRIERHHYLAMLRRYVPDAGISTAGQSSGAYRLKPVAGRDMDTCSDQIVSSTDGHRLRHDFNPGDRIGKYLVIEKIGQGGMGVVYRVTDTSLGGEYALKAFLATSEDCQMQKERFRTEAKLLRKLDHKGLPKVYDCDYDVRQECLFLVEDLIVGEDGKPHELARYTCSQSAAKGEGLELVSEQQALSWLREVCGIVDYLHRQGVEHRDITLKNLLVSRDGNIKLTDFGIAKVIDEKLREEVNANVTMTFTQTPNGAASFLGTMRYLPPEVKDKKKNLISSEATDMWSMGVCFFRLLTADWFEGHQFADYVWNGGPWGMLMGGMLKTDSRKRFSCAKVLAILDSLNSPSVGDKDGKATADEKRRSRSLASTVAGCLQDTLGVFGRLKPKTKGSQSCVVLIDGDNLLRTPDVGARGLYYMVSALKESHYEPRIFFSSGCLFEETKTSADARYFYRLTAGMVGGSIEEYGSVEFALIEEQMRLGCDIVSNDSFKDARLIYPEVATWDMYGGNPLCTCHRVGKRIVLSKFPVEIVLPKSDEMRPEDGLKENPDDRDLDFLFGCSAEELEPVVAAILGTTEVKDPVGRPLHDDRGNQVRQIDRSGRFSSRLDEQSAFKKHFPDHTRYVSDIIAELQRFAGNTIVNLGRGYGVTYREMLLDVMKARGLKVDKTSAVRELEDDLLKSVIGDVRKTMGLEERRVVEKELFGEKGDSDPDHVSESVAASIVAVLAQQLSGRSLNLPAAGLAGIAAPLAAAFGGPLGWVVSGALAAIGSASAAFRVTIPACVYISALRRVKDTVGRNLAR